MNLVCFGMVVDNVVFDVVFMWVGEIRFVIEDIVDFIYEEVVWD